MQQVNKKRKKLGLALPGCAGKAIAYIGMLEVFDENHIPINCIAACSSATLVACSYAAGTMQKLKEYYFGITDKEFFEFFEPSFNGGLFSLDRVEDALAEIITVENLEDLKIQVAIVASDIIEGKEVHFTMGNLMRAIKASSAYPGIFEPVVWGDKVLIDGGLFSIVPVEAVEEMNADIIIGVEMPTIRNLFMSSMLGFKRGYNIVKTPFSLINKYVGTIRNSIFRKEQLQEMTINELKSPGFINIIAKAMDYAIEERKKNEQIICSLLLKPNLSEYGKVDRKNMYNVYEEGRRTALAALPRIKELLND